ncbi:MAG: alpha/beta fold hydrolase [Rhizobiales bacterium]|nr:alpha/beta fold hydrolase [Hyphomicrobiales bacterium]
MYFPDPVRHAPAASGLDHFEEITFTSSDGVRLLAWYAPPRDGSKSLVIYFQGNGGGLDLRAHRFGRLAAAGLGVLALNYRGFGGSSGAPSEEGILRDADAAYAFAVTHVPAERIVLWGESLGTGVAVALAAERPVARVLLESPYTSTADIAAATYWYVPVRLLMRDQFRSDARIAKVTAPVMILHGARDTVVPIRYGERLYDLVRAPKRFVRLPEAGHNDHDDFGGLDAVTPFLADGTL